jgi:uroporphyrinogen-III synthase
MIPKPIPPLTALSVLVTRPAGQAQSLCARISASGGEAIAFPVMTIEPVAVTTPSGSFDTIIFTSVNAVLHGLANIDRASARIAAIGKATATALQSAKIAVDTTVPPPHTSESLLAMPEFADVADKRILIVRGAGGRDVLRAALTERGATVELLDAYRRVPINPTDKEIAALEERWQSGGIHVVTLTSVEILECLRSVLTERGRELLIRTPFVAVSERIADAARVQGLSGHCMLARAADDDAIVGALAQWHARAKNASN